MAMHLVLFLPALIDKRELEQRPDISALAGQGNEDGDVGGAVLGVLAVGVEVDGPIVAANGEVVAGDVLADPHALGEGVALDGEPVGPVHRLRDGPRGGGREEEVFRRGARGGHWCTRM